MEARLCEFTFARDNALASGLGGEPAPPAVQSPYPAVLFVSQGNSCGGASTANPDRGASSGGRQVFSAMAGGLKNEDVDAFTNVEPVRALRPLSRANARNSVQTWNGAPRNSEETRHYNRKRSRCRRLSQVFGTRNCSPTFQPFSYVAASPSAMRMRPPMVNDMCRKA